MPRLIPIYRELEIRIYRMDGLAKTPKVRQGKLIVIIPVWLSGSEFLFVKTFAFNGNKRSDV